jgi:hypothetical protein
LKQEIPLVPYLIHLFLSKFTQSPSGRGHPSRF